MDIFDIFMIIAIAGLVSAAQMHIAYKPIKQEARITRDIQLESPALDKLDSMEKATITDQRRLIKMMMAASELPSYVTEEVANAGAAAVITLIEQTSYQRTQASHMYVETGLVATA